VSPTPQTQEPVSSADLEALAEQLGRVPRGVVALAARRGGVVDGLGDIDVLQ